MASLRGRESKSRSSKLGRSRLHSSKKTLVSLVETPAVRVLNPEDSDYDSDAELVDGQDADGEEVAAVEAAVKVLDLGEEGVTTVVDNLGERRTETRVLALRQLAAYLRAGAGPELFSSHIETLELHLSSILKKAQTAELPDLCDVISVLAFAFGEDDGGFLLPAFLDPLIVLVQNWSAADGSRIAALSAVGSLLFVFGSDAQTEAGLRLCEHVFVQQHSKKRGIIVPMKDRSPELLARALQVWGFLASSLDLDRLAGVHTARHLTQFGELLEHGSAVVRGEAGENLALLHEAYQLAENPDFQALADAEDAEEELPAQELHTRPNFNRWLARLEELAEGSVGDRHQLGRKDRRTERSNFREILKSVQVSGDNWSLEESTPSEAVVVGKHRHILQGWRALRRWGFCRRALAGGFHTHLQEGSGLLPEILGLDLDEEAEVDAAAAGEGRVDHKAIRQAVYRENQRSVQQDRERGRQKKVAQQQALHQED